MSRRRQLLIRKMLLLQILRLAVIVVVAVAWLARGQWTHFFFWVRLNWLWFVLAYVVLTLTIRTLESRRRDTAFGRLLRRLGLKVGPQWTCDACEAGNIFGTSKCSECGRARAVPPWICEVCETENPGEEVRCSRCTVPRPQGAS